jgi:hypothetical protein
VQAVSISLAARHRAADEFAAARVYLERLGWCVGDKPAANERRTKYVVNANS